MKFLLPLLLLLSGCGAGAGGPEACALVRETVIPMTFMGNLPTVAVLVNGDPVQLILDTGASHTVITAAAFKRLGLASDSTLRGFATAVGGSGATPVGMVSKLELGEVSRRSLNIFVVDMPAMGGGKIDGLLGNDILSEFDLDLDFRADRLTLYRQRRCPQGRPDWSEPYEALARPAQGRALPATMISLAVDGVQQNAVVDTGATRTAMDRSRALVSGATTEGLAIDRQGSVQGATLKAISAGLHQFTKMQVGSETIRTPRIAVTAKEGQLGNSYFGMLLGLDYLRKRRVWIAYEEHMVYVSRPTP
jgi:predicted aspartyl protease